MQDPLNCGIESFAITDFTAQKLILQVEFENPVSISTGQSPDYLTLKIVDPNWFISQSSYASIQPGRIDGIAI